MSITQIISMLMMFLMGVTLGTAGLSAQDWQFWAVILFSSSQFLVGYIQSRQHYLNELHRHIS